MEFPQEHGGVAEWPIAPVLKTGGCQSPVSSNLTASANLNADQPLEHGQHRMRTSTTAVGSLSLDETRTSVSLLSLGV